MRFSIFLLFLALAATAAAQDLVVVASAPDARLEAARASFGAHVVVRQGGLEGADVVWTTSPALVTVPVVRWAPSASGALALVRSTSAPAAELPRTPLDLAHPRWRDRVAWPASGGDAAAPSGELAVLAAESVAAGGRFALVFYFEEEERGASLVPAAGLLAGARHPEAARRFLESLAEVAPRDPFATTERMAEAARLGGEEGGKAPEFRPAEGSEGVPAIRLEGFVEGEGSEPVALLEIQGHGTFFVRTGDTLSLQIGGRNVVIKIERISNLSVHVEVGTLGQVIVVR